MTYLLISDDWTEDPYSDYYKHGEFSTFELAEKARIDVEQFKVDREKFKELLAKATESYNYYKEQFPEKFELEYPVKVKGRETHDLDSRRSHFIRIGNIVEAEKTLQEIKNVQEQNRQNNIDFNVTLAKYLELKSEYDKRRDEFIFSMMSGKDLKIYQYKIPMFDFDLKYKNLRVVGKKTDTFVAPSLKDILNGVEDN